MQNYGELLALKNVVDTNDHITFRKILQIILFTLCIFGIGWYLGQTNNKLVETNQFLRPRVVHEANYGSC